MVFTRTGSGKEPSKECTVNERSLFEYRKEKVQKPVNTGTTGEIISTLSG